MENNDPVIRWYNGAAQREYEFLSAIQQLFSNINQQNVKNIVEEIQRNIRTRKHVLEVVENKWDISVMLSYGLGLAFGFGLGLVVWSETLKSFGLWLCALSIFHLWEYLYVSLYHPNELCATCMLSLSSLFSNFLIKMVNYSHSLALSHSIISPSSFYILSTLFIIILQLFY
jgi:hypothetical protein